MPLIKGDGKKAFSQNVRTEMHAGKSQKQSLAIAYAMKKKRKKMAEGGEVEYHDEEMASGEDMNDACPSCDGDGCAACDGGDVVGRIMKSRGGEVANGDEDPTDIDDLALDDDLEMHDTGESSGDELGPDEEELGKDDLVSRILKRLPRK